MLITKMETCRGKVLVLQKDLTHRLINEIIGALKPKKIAVKAVTALYLLLRAAKPEAVEEPTELQWEELHDFFTYKKRLLYEITDVKRRIETEIVDLDELTLLKARFFKEEEQVDHSRSLLDKNVRLVLSFVSNCVNYALYRNRLKKETVNDGSYKNLIGCALKEKSQQKRIANSTVELSRAGFLKNMKQAPVDDKSCCSSRNVTPQRSNLQVTKHLNASSSCQTLNPEKARHASPSTKGIVKHRLLESQRSHGLVKHTSSRGSLNPSGRRLQKALPSSKEEV